jgi:IS5 family transposase
MSRFKEPLIKSSTGAVLASNGMWMEIAMRQITFANQPSFEKYARPSRREQFLQTMESVVPWSELEPLIAPHYPKAGNGRQPVGLSIMLRI